MAELACNKLVVAASVIAVLTGCSSQPSRMAECEAKGVSRDTCYVAEQSRQAAITGAAENQVLENAQDAYPQRAQSVRKVTAFTKHYDGMTIKRDKLGFVTVDGKPAAQDEMTA